jgi:hypothetical protein
MNLGSAPHLHEVHIGVPPWIFARTRMERDLLLDRVKDLFRKQLVEPWPWNAPLLVLSKVNNAKSSPIDSTARIFYDTGYRSSLVYSYFRHWTSNSTTYKGKAERVRIINDFESLSIEERKQVARRTAVHLTMSKYPVRPLLIQLSSASNIPPGAKLGLSHGVTSSVVILQGSRSLFVEVLKRQISTRRHFLMSI